MRTIYVLLLPLLVGHFGCGRPTTATTPPHRPETYHPETFRADIKSLIDKKQYSAAVAYLNSADPKLQANYDKQGYLAVGEDAIVLPGEAPSLSYNSSRDWYIPGTQDAIQDEAWQSAATEFAEQYNHARDGK